MVNPPEPVEWTDESIIALEALLTTSDETKSRNAHGQPMYYGRDAIELHDGSYKCVIVGCQIPIPFDQTFVSHVSNHHGGHVGSHTYA